MKKLLTRLVTIPLLALSIALPVSVVPASARPIVKVSECRVDFNATMDWNNLGEGKAKDLWLQVAAVHDSLPERCRPMCGFTNIDPDAYRLMITRRFVGDFVPASVMSHFQEKCYIEVNPAKLLMDSNGSAGVICLTGNSFTLTISGNGNTVNAGQAGCNTAVITINGNAAILTIRQDGKNSLRLILNGDNITASVSQIGTNVYSGTLSSGAVAHINQNNL